MNRTTICFAAILALLVVVGVIADLSGVPSRVHERATDAQPPIRRETQPTGYGGDGAVHGSRLEPVRPR